MGTKLGFLSLLFVFHGAEIAHCRVSAPRVVEALDIVVHIGLGIVPSAIDLAGGAFGLERGEEALHGRVVPDIAGPAHRAGDAEIGHQALELLAGILAALAGVVQQAVGLAAAPDGHDQRIGHQLSGFDELIDQPTTRRE